MLLNTKIFNATVETAKTKSANNPAMLRAIERAVNEINRSKYWAFDSQTNVLKLMSTTSSKLYIIDDAHICEAESKICKHLVARRLMQRYTEALGVAVAEGERALLPGEQSACGQTHDASTPIHQPTAPLKPKFVDVFLGQPRGVARRQRWDWHREF